MVTKKTHPESSSRLLARLAELYGVQTHYRDALGCERETSDESLTKTLLALGADVHGASGDGGRRRLEEAIRLRQAEPWTRTVEPVCIAWEGRQPELAVRLPASLADSDAGLALTLTLEDGTEMRGEVGTDRLARRKAAEVDGRGFVALGLPPGLCGRALGSSYLPMGYHRLLIEADGIAGETLLISAPRRCWEPEGRAGRNLGRQSLSPDDRGVSNGAGDRLGSGGVWDTNRSEVIDRALHGLADREWGLFAPVYALRSERDWGAGDLADLEALAGWTADWGGSMVATLPLLASSFGEDADPSPYRPLTRLFWNEFFLAPERTDEWDRCDAARRMAGRLPARRQREALRASEMVDYRAVMGLKREILEELARCFFADPVSAVRQGYEAYLRDHPFALDYAAFRAKEEGPARAAAVGDGARAGAAAARTAAYRAAGDRAAGGSTRNLAAGGEGLTAEQYHLYCQWQMERQLGRLSADGRPGLLFDLPVGVHPAGFDITRWPELFASGVSTGAPPDTFFANGQDWATPPLRPETDRNQGYAYFAACLRNLMRHATVLRVDHMMSFHRLFFIPEGMAPKDGAYVTYPAEELYAVLSRESHRHQTAVVGEDLGTVPAGVRASMNRHGVRRTWIFLGSLKPRGGEIAREAPTGSVVTLETHDMVPLAGFLCGDDIETRLETGQLDAAGARRESAERRWLVSRLAGRFVAPDDTGGFAAGVLAGCLAYLGRSAAKTVLVNLEDLLLERRPQNVPGTTEERPNWRRKIAVALEELPRRGHR